VPSLLDHVDRRIHRFIGDGIFDQEPVYAAVERHSSGARVIIPPRKDAVLSPTASTAPTQRDQHLLAIGRVGRFQWKRTSGYYARVTLNMPFRDTKGRSEAFYGQRGTKRRSGKRRSRADCSIGCGNWVGLSPLRSAESGMQGDHHKVGATPLAAADSCLSAFQGTSAQISPAGPHLRRGSALAVRDAPRAVSIASVAASPCAG
jgi:hypothetical protein